jgi:hypothetical protein
MLELHLHSSMRIDYVVLNYLGRETYLPFSSAPTSHRLNVRIQWLQSVRDFMYDKYLCHQQKVDTWNNKLHYIRLLQALKPEAPE